MRAAACLQIIDAEELDVPKFQEMVQEDRRKYQLSQDMKLNRYVTVMQPLCNRYVTVM